MSKTKEMFDATHRRNEQFSWNQWYEEQDESLENIGNWLDHDLEGASHALGEDLVSAISEVIDYE